MQVTYTENKPNEKLWFVEITTIHPAEFFINKENVLYMKNEGYVITDIHRFSKGNYEVIGKIDDITEEQIKKIINLTKFEKKYIYNSYSQKLKLNKKLSGYKDNVDTDCLLINEKIK